MYQARARLFQMLSLESRLMILDELRYGDACVCHLQHRMYKPQAYVSQQLRVLKDAGIVSTRRDGVNVFYQLTDPLTRSLVDLAVGPVDRTRPVDPSCPCPCCSSQNE